MLSLTSQSPKPRRGRDYDPWEHAAGLGIDVLVRPLTTAHELWLPEVTTLVLKAGMRPAAERVALAHGLGHAEFGHEDDRPKHEKQADQFAARNLIDPDELADLYKWCPDEGRLIQELGVTRRLLRAYLAE